MSKQMEADLANRLREKLQQWISDSEALFEMGRMRKFAAFEAIIQNLLYALVWRIVRHMPQKCDDDFVDAFKTLLAQARKDIAENAKQKAKAVRS